MSFVNNLKIIFTTITKCNEDIFFFYFKSKYDKQDMKKYIIVQLN